MRGYIALAALIGAASPAFAAKADFQTCDGYPAPDKKGDGIVTSTWLFGLARADVDIRRHQTAIGSEATAACDRALADPLLQPGFWLRRAHLLQAKALHLIADRKDEEALPVLAASDEIGAAQADPYFDGSVALGNKALRAMALYRLDRREAAAAELEAIEAARPHAASLKTLARSIRLLYENDLDTFIGQLRRAAPTDPSALEPLFRLSIVHARFADAAALHGQIVHDLPRGRGAWQIEGLAEQKYELIALRAELAGAAAYALTTEGKPEAAAAMLAAARADLEDAREAPQPDAKGRIKKKVQADFIKRRDAADSGSAKLAAWEKSLALREWAAATPVEEMLPVLADRISLDAPVMLDLLRISKAPDEQHRRMVEETVRMMTAAIEEGRRKEISLKYVDLARMLPRPETARQRPTFKSAAPTWLIDTGNGFYVKKQKDSAAISVGYGNDLATPATVEELGMLAAAAQARAAGKDSFLIESRMMIQRTVQNYMYSTLMSSAPAGYELRLRILPVSSNALPAELEAARWRLVDAEKVYRELYPKYTPAPNAND